MKFLAPFLATGVVHVLLLLAELPCLLAQPPDGDGGGGPPDGGEGGPPDGGGGGAASGDAATPGGVNILCDDSSTELTCLTCELNTSTVVDDPLLDTRRRRYEVRDMPSEEWDTFVFGMLEMKTLTMEEGQALYGPLFKTQEFLVTMHAVASKSIRGDQGHFGSQFLSFHTAFGAMIETTLLAIAQATERPFSGIPYYWTLDTDAADVLTADYFGTHPGLGDAYEVTDGPFANWTIAGNVDILDDYADAIVNSTDNGFPVTGNYFNYLRSTANNASNPLYLAYPTSTDDLGEGIAYTGFEYDTILACLETPYDSSTYTIYNFTYCINDWHNLMHSGIGGRASSSLARYDEDTMANTEGDLSDVDTSPNAPVFASFHATIDMFLREWASRYPEGANVTWGMPYANSYNYVLGSVVDGASGNDVISSAWPMTWADVGWAPPNTTEGNALVTHAQAYCKLAQENAPYVYVRYSGAPDTAPGLAVLESTYVVDRYEEGIPLASNDTYITGTIYCDNYFQFYFNGELIAEDPMTFIPHQAVEVAFTWDGVSPKEYAILCQDFATDSGYEYTESTTPGIGDGALVAAFSDGTRSSADWSIYVVTYGPTEESEADGCSDTNLDVCVVEDLGLPSDDWFAAGFDFSDWDLATVYTSDEAGWGRTPTWTEGLGCCTSISPLTREDLVTNSGCSVNYDLDTGEEVLVDVDESGCIDPKSFFDTDEVYSDAAFIWGSSLTKDNQMLFRLTVEADDTTTTDDGDDDDDDTTTTTPAPASTSTPTAAPEASTTSSTTVSSLYLSTVAIATLIVAGVFGG